MYYNTITTEKGMMAISAHFIISGFSDEIDEKIEKQFACLNRLGISYFEPRGINGKNIADLTEQERKSLKREMDASGIKASSIGSPIGKIRITDDFAPHLEKLKQVMATAQTLDTKYIRIFSFFIPKGEDPARYRSRVMERMAKMLELAEKEGVVLLHENEKEIYGDTARRCKDIFDSVPSPALGCVFDPANFVQCGQEVYPQAYDLLSGHICYLHIKDAKEDGTVVPAGYGCGGLRDVFARLAERKYHGFVSLEPHLGSFTGLAELEQSDKMLKLEQSGEDKFQIAYDALQSILEEL